MNVICCERRYLTFELFFPALTYAAECFCLDVSNCDGTTWESVETCVAFNAAHAREPTIVSSSCFFSICFCLQANRRLTESFSKNLSSAWLSRLDLNGIIE